MLCLLAWYVTLSHFMVVQSGKGYSKTCVKQPLSKRRKIGFQDQLSLNAGEHSAILSTFIKLQFVIKICFLFFEWPLKTGFTVADNDLALFFVGSCEESEEDHFNSETVLCCCGSSGRSVQAPTWEKTVTKGLSLFLPSSWWVQMIYVETIFILPSFCQSMSSV